MREACMPRRFQTCSSAFTCSCASLQPRREATLWSSIACKLTRSLVLRHRGRCESREMESQHVICDPTTRIQAWNAVDNFDSKTRFASLEIYFMTARVQVSVLPVFSMSRSAVLECTVMVPRGKTSVNEYRKEASTRSFMILPEMKADEKAAHIELSLGVTGGIWSSASPFEEVDGVWKIERRRCEFNLSEVLSLVLRWIGNEVRQAIWQTLQGQASTCRI